MFGIIKLTIHTITGMWVSIVLFKLMTNGWSGFYFQCCVLSTVFLTVSWLLSGEWLAGRVRLNPHVQPYSHLHVTLFKAGKEMFHYNEKTGTK